MRKVLVLGLSVLAPTFASAQSLNIDFNWNIFGNTNPSSGYAAAGLAGTWNLFEYGFMGNQNYTNILGLNGAATAADFSWLIDGSSSAIGPLTGDDHRLLQDSFFSSNPISLSSLLNGTYTIYMYGHFTSASTAFSMTATMGAVTKSLGGAAWTGSHVENGSYVRFDGVNVTNGSLSIAVDGSVSGMQLVYGPQSVPEPVTMALMGGAAVAGFRRLRRKKAA